MTNAVIVSTARTPLAKSWKGAFNMTHGATLGGHAVTGIGLVTPVFLLQQWRVALVGIFVITAAITPGDVVSAQIVMGGPMALLYFVSVGLSFLVAKRKTKAEEAEAAEFERGDVSHD